MNLTIKSTNMECLVIKLKGTVSDSSLPVLETMQQFTLNAINASGNDSMTEAQKWALNHFFYEIGAIENTPLWQKINVLVMPMICNDNLGRALVNYVDNAVTAGNAKWAFENHGLVVAQGEDGGTRANLAKKFNGNGWNLSCIFLTTASSIRNIASPATLRIYSGAGTFSDFGAGGTSYTFIGRALSQSTTFTKSELASLDYDIMAVNVTDSATAVHIKSSMDAAPMQTATNSDTEGRFNKLTYTNGNIDIQINGEQLGLAIEASPLTYEENVTLLNAVASLKAAFVF